MTTTATAWANISTSPRTSPTQFWSGTPPFFTISTKPSPTFTSPPEPDPTTPRSTQSLSTSGGCSQKPRSWRWPSAAFPASGPMVSTTVGYRTIASGSPKPTTPSADSTKSNPTVRTSPKNSNSPQPPPVASGIGQILHSRPSSGDRATIPTSRNPQSFSHSTRSPRRKTSTSKTTGSKTNAPFKKAKTVPST